jgi:hypothetical protein
MKAFFWTVLALIFIMIGQGCSECRKACLKATECGMVSGRRFELCIEQCEKDRENDPSKWQARINEMLQKSCEELKPFRK